MYLFALLVSRNDYEISASCSVRRLQEPGKLPPARFDVRHVPCDLNKPLGDISFRHDEIALSGTIEVRQLLVVALTPKQFKVDGVLQPFAVVV